MMKRLSAAVAVALAFGLCAAPAARSAGCAGEGDPVYDPGSNGQCTFAVGPVMPGAEASVLGRFYGMTPIVRQPSYLEDTADDGLDAYLWVRSVRLNETHEKWIARASGLGATTTVGSLGIEVVDEFHLRVCIGPDTTNCSAWHG